MWSHQFKNSLNALIRTMMQSENDLAESKDPDPEALKTLKETNNRHNNKII